MTRIAWLDPQSHRAGEGVEIETAGVTALLMADGWHELAPESFAIVPAHPVELVDPYTDEAVSWRPGFHAVEVVGNARFHIAGPLSAVLAVRDESWTADREHPRWYGVKTK